MRCLSRPRPPAYRLSSACRYGKGRRGTAVVVRARGVVFPGNAVGRPHPCEIRDSCDGVRLRAGPGRATVAGTDGPRSAVVCGPASEVVRPPLHERPALLEQVGAGIGLHHGTA